MTYFSSFFLSRTLLLKKWREKENVREKEKEKRKRNNDLSFFFSEVLFVLEHDALRTFLLSLGREFSLQEKNEGEKTGRKRKERERREREKRRKMWSFLSTSIYFTSKTWFCCSFIHSQGFSSFSSLPLSFFFPFSFSLDPRSSHQNQRERERERESSFSWSMSCPCLL